MAQQPAIYRKSRVSSNQRRAITPYDLYDPYEYERSRLEAEAGQQSERDRLALQKEQMDNAQDLQKQQGKASTVSGITGLANTAIMGKMAWNMFNPNPGNPALNNPALVSGPESAGTLPATGQSATGMTSTGAGYNATGSATIPTNTGAASTPSSVPALTANSPTEAVMMAQNSPTAVPVAGQNFAITSGGQAVNLPASTGAATTGATSGTTTASTAGAGATSYLGPAAAGFSAPAIVDTIHKDSMENLGHNITAGTVRNERAAGVVGSTATGAGAGAAAGSVIPGVGTAIGAVIGGLAGFAKGMLDDDSWLCTAMDIIVGLDERQHLDIIRLRKYALEMHPDQMEFYLKYGPDLIKAIDEEYPDEEKLYQFYSGLKTYMLIPCLEKVTLRQMEYAYQLYKDITTELFTKYTPEIELPVEQEVA